MQQNSDIGEPHLLVLEFPHLTNDLTYQLVLVKSYFNIIGRIVYKLHYDIDISPLLIFLKGNSLLPSKRCTSSPHLGLSRVFDSWHVQYSQLIKFLE